MSLKFECSHCSKEEEYTIQEARSLQSKVKELRGHTVCPDCFIKYNTIDSQVKTFAEQKRKELEDIFFNTKPEVEEEVKEEEDKD